MGVFSRTKGFETARALVLHGANVVMACRDLSAAESAKRLIEEENQPRVNDVLLFDFSSLLQKGSVDVLHLDLADLHSVELFAEQFLASERPLHALICNAELIAPPYRVTDSGFETTFQVNECFYVCEK